MTHINASCNPALNKWKQQYNLNASKKMICKPLFWRATVTLPLLSYPLVSCTSIALPVEPRERASYGELRARTGVWTQNIPFNYNRTFLAMLFYIFNNTNEWVDESINNKILMNSCKYFCVVVCIKLLGECLFTPANHLKQTVNGKRSVTVAPVVISHTINSIIYIFKGCILNWGCVLLFIFQKLAKLT